MLSHARRRLAQFVLAVATLASPSLSQAADAGAGACARAMVREPFAYMTPEPKYRDPRTALPHELTVTQRRELHAVLWPSQFSGRLSVRQWLFDRNFDCMEEAFADLTATQARYPDGTLKLVSFLGGARDFVEANRGMTEAEIDDLVKAWRSRHPDSLLPDLLWPRLLMAAAWSERGTDWAANVPPRRMKEFRRLAAVALRRALALRPEAREHVLGHYVALRTLVDNGASVQHISTFALEGLRRFQEPGLASIAAERMLPKWGGSPTDFERFAQAARAAVQPALADRVYANVYVQSAGIEQLHQHPLADLERLRAGLSDMASQGGFDGILLLQEFACARQDGEALRQAQALWQAYGSEPQLRAPQTDLDARCRAWERSLPAVAAAQAASKAPASAVSSVFHPAASREVARSLYDVQAESWERLDTPAGEVFSCKVCEYPVQVVVAVGPLLAAHASFTTNERFMATLDTPESQARVARDHTAQSAQLDAAQADRSLKIERTQFAEVDGVKAFRYESVLRLSRATLRETALELVHRGRMLRIAVNRADGPVGSMEQKAVQGLIESVKLRAE